MKACDYCGRENASEAGNCFECGTAFTIDQAVLEKSNSLDSCWRTNPSLSQALKAGGAFILILTAAATTTARIAFDLAEFANGERIGKPGIYGVGILALFYIIPVLMIVTPALVVACILRCRSIGIGLTCSSLAFVIAVVLFLVRPLLLLLPAILLGKLMGSSVGFYLGAAVQLLWGAWLFGWKGQGSQPAEQATDFLNINADKN